MTSVNGAIGVRWRGDEDMLRRLQRLQHPSQQQWAAARSRYRLAGLLAQKVPGGRCSVMPA